MGGICSSRGPSPLALGLVSGAWFLGLGESCNGGLLWSFVFLCFSLSFRYVLLCVSSMWFSLVTILAGWGAPWAPLWFSLDTFCGRSGDLSATFFLWLPWDGPPKLDREFWPGY